VDPIAKTILEVDLVTFRNWNAIRDDNHCAAILEGILIRKRGSTSSTPCNIPRLRSGLR
jgi:hypothetical protein